MDASLNEPTGPAGQASATGTPIPVAIPYRGAPMGMPPPGTASPPPPVFLPVHWQELIAAQGRARSVRRVISWTQANGWTTAIFAGITLLVAFSSISGWVLGAGMALLAWNEFRGGRQVRQLKPQACRMLGFNQLAFAALLTLYALWSLYAAATGPSPLAAEMAKAGIDSRSLSSLGVDGLDKLIYFLIYGTLIAVAVFGCGGMALYYFARQRVVRDYVANTPAWIIDLQRAMKSL